MGKEHHCVLMQYEINTKLHKNYLSISQSSCSAKTWRLFLGANVLNLLYFLFPKNHDVEPQFISFNLSSFYTMHILKYSVSLGEIWIYVVFLYLISLIIMSLHFDLKV